MKNKGIISYLVVFLYAGMLLAAVEKPSFQIVKGKALELHRSLIGFATPAVKSKIAAAAQAAKGYLAACGRTCDLGRFTSKDLKARFTGLTGQELPLLQALVFAETVGDDSQLDSLELQENMQKQSQFLQAISNIMKSQHDTLKAIIQNLRG